MRAFIVSLALLAAALTASFFAAARTQSLCDKLGEAADGAGTVAELKKIWEEEQGLVRLTVRGEQADKVSDALNELEAAGKDGPERKKAMLRFREALRELEENGGLSLSGVL